MGSFSWLKADNLTKVSNVAYGKSFKFLIPKEFGGGFIKDTYQDYGYLGQKENGEPKYDMYELLAFWNHELISDRELKYDGEFPKMKEIDDYTDHNRILGIDIGCYDDQIDKLKYPLKLVSASYNGTYEDLETYSYGDPNQGFGETKRESENRYFRYLDELRESGITNMLGASPYLVDEFGINKNEARKILSE
ncbi:MAG: hypothetical protein PHT02_01065 [Tissierellia bacterium]|nr:hypothetical protein [Tissierellia bacterium]